VKPANILVGPEDRAYLSDFGAVKELASAGMTRTGAFVGTIEYCAPEQIEGGEVDARTDVYALACVLYETLTGTAPFHRPSEVAVLNAHLHAPPPRLTKAAPGVPHQLEHVVQKALSKSPLDRYATPGELIAAARAAAAEHRVDARRLALSLGLLFLVGLLGAGIALAVRSLAFAGHTHTTTTSLVPKQPPFDLQRFLELKDGRTLNDIGFILIGAHRYKEARPILEKAYENTHDYPVHAYATFNLGYVLLQLGDCKRSLQLFQEALPKEPKDAQPLVRRRIKQARKTCRRS
jgi:serine/threonine protein kinase